MKKLWEILAYRMIILNHQDLSMFKSLTQEKVKIFTKMCNIQIYKPGDPVDMKSGGVIFRGGLSRINQEFKEFTKNMNKAEAMNEAIKGSQDTMYNVGQNENSKDQKLSNLSQSFNSKATGAYA